MDELIQEKVVQKENELNATYDERIRNYEERCVRRRSLLSSNLIRRREQDLQRQASLTKSQLRELRMSHESSQARLLDQTQRQGMQNTLIDVSFQSVYNPSIDQEVVDKLTELDMMVADLERANSRVVTVERRNVCCVNIPGPLYIEGSFLGTPPCGD